MADPTPRETSANETCGRGAAIAARAQCAISAIAVDAPDLIANFDIWRPLDIGTGRANQRGTVLVRLKENIRIARVRRDRFRQTAVGMVEENTERMTLVPAIGLRAGDILVRKRDGVAFKVDDLTNTVGVESLKVTQQMALFAEPTPNRGTLRLAFVGAQVDSLAAIPNGLVTEDGEQLVTDAGELLLYA